MKKENFQDFTAREYPNAFTFRDAINNLTDEELMKAIDKYAKTKVVQVEPNSKEMLDVLLVNAIRYLTPDQRHTLTLSLIERDETIISKMVATQTETTKLHGEFWHKFSLVIDEKFKNEIWDWIEAKFVKRLPEIQEYQPEEIGYLILDKILTLNVTREELGEPIIRLSQDERYFIAESISMKIKKLVVEKAYRLYTKGLHEGLDIGIKRLVETIKEIEKKKESEQ